jgi:hypothetical protein
MCCGGSRSAVRVQIPPAKPSPQSVRIVSQPVGLYLNNKQTKQTVEVGHVRKKPPTCPLCQHVVMTSRIGGRIRNQCTNFSCRHILD